MAHRLIVRCSKQNMKAREIQELLMTRRARKQPTMLEVHVMFEPNREAQHVLHTAYTFLLPIRRRQRLPHTRTETISPEIQSRVGERKLP
jgi:hypothetical protein